MADRVIVRRITQTKVLIRNTEQGPKVIVRNKGPKGDPGDDADVTAETAARIAADAVLAAADATEATARATADALLIPLTQKGAANGVASLDGTGKVPTAQLPIAAALGSVTYQGTWNATTNTPTIPAAAVGNKGYYYRVATAGTTTVDGVNDWKVGDWIVSDGAIWQKVDNTDPAGVSDVPGLVTALGLKADQTGLDSEETDRIAGDATLQAEIDALPTSSSGGGSVVHYGDGVPDPALGVQGDSYVDRLTGNLYKKWSKPASWAWNAADVEPDSADLAADVKLLMAAAEGSGGTVKELVSNTPMTLPASVTWAVQDGIPVLRFDGSGDGIHAPAPVIGQSTEWTEVVVLRAPTGTDMAIYTEVGPGGTDESYAEPVFVLEAGANGIIASDTYAAVTDPDELYAVTAQPVGVVDLTRLRVVVIRRLDNVITFMLDGVVLTNDPGIHDDDNLVVPAPALALIGISSADGVGFSWGPLSGEIAGLAVWDTAKSNAELQRISANPLGVARQAGADLASEPGIWVLEAELATQEELDAEEAARIAGDGALDTRVDALEAAGPFALDADLDAEVSTRSGETSALDGRLDTVEPLTPSSGEKAALAGTSGTPGSGNKYVTDGDARNTNARTPSAHVHPESEVTNLVTDLAGKQALATNLTAIAALVGASDRLAYFTGVGALSLATFTAFGRTLAALADYAALRTGAGLVIGTDVQAFHTNLSALAGLSLIADRLPYANGSGTLALTTLSAFIRTLLDDADAATAIATLGAVATGDSRLSDSRAPNGTAGGQLGGTYPNPDVRGLRETSGPTALTLGAVADGEVLTRVGSTVVGSTPGTVPADDSITNAKLANMANATIKGRTTTGTGDPEDLTASQVRSILALVIGTNVQAWAAKLDTLAALTWAADKGLYFTSASVAATFDLTSFGRSLVDDADAATARATLGLAALAVLATVGTSQIDNDAVTYAKLQNISATARLLGRVTAGAGDAEEIPLGTGLAFSAGSLTSTVTAPSAATASVLGTVKIAGTPGDAANPTVNVQEQEATFYGWRRFKTGFYYDGGGAISTSAGNLATTQSVATPFYVGATTTFDRIAIEVTTGTATSVVRLAVYADNGSGYPGARVYDGSTVSAASIAVVTLTISLQLTPGLYWLVAQAEVATAVVRRMTTGVSTQFVPASLVAATDFSIHFCCWTCNSGVSAGSNPNPWYATTVPSSQACRVMLRAA